MFFLLVYILSYVYWLVFVCCMEMRRYSTILFFLNCIQFNSNINKIFFYYLFLNSCFLLFFPFAFKWIFRINRIWITSGKKFVLNSSFVFLDGFLFLFIFVFEAIKTEPVRRVFCFQLVRLVTLYLVDSIHFIYKIETMKMF